MSTQVVLKNIHYYLNTVLQNAFFSPGWDEKLFQNAMKWALYCEKVYESSANKKFADQLDDYICQIATSIPYCVVPQANLLFLKNSTSFLKQALLQNPFLNKEVLHSIIKTSFETDGFEQELTNVAALKSGIVVMLEWMEHDSLNVTNSKCPFLWKDVKADLLLHHIWKVLATHTTKEENEAYLSKFLLYLTTSKEKLELLLCVLALNVETTSHLQKLQLWMLDWLLKYINENSQCSDTTIYEKVWSLSPDILCLVAARHFLFYKAYISMLMQFGKVFEPEYTSTGYSWKLGLQLLKIPVFKFEDFVQHFKCLLCKGKEVSKTTVLILSSVASNSNNCCLWQDILQHCQADIKTNIITDGTGISV